MIKKTNPIADWHHSDYAAHYYACEREYLNTGLRQCVGPSMLQVGSYLDGSLVAGLDLPFVVQAESVLTANSSVVLDPAFLPFDADSFSTVLLPHSLESHSLPHQLLREGHRVLLNEGHIVITGFNPYSFMGLQRFVRRSAVCSGQYHSVAKVIDWLQLLGFEVVSSSMFQYAPLSKRVRLQKTYSLLETVGQRCFPIFGGGYMISAKKRELGGRFVGRLSAKRRRTKLMPVSASVTRNKTSK